MDSAFRLDVGQDRLATLTFDLPDKKVNIFNRAVLEELEELVDELARRDDIDILILLSGKETNFIAGADVDMIADVTDPATAEAGSRFGQRVFAAWERLPFPTVAAIHGTCRGGGTEIALASTWRVVSDGDKSSLGLPEVQLGIVPAWGGCTRLPRLLELPDALEMILTGKTIRPKKALRTGLVDALLPHQRFLDEVRDFARERAGKERERERPGLKELLLEKNPIGRKVVFDQARKQTLSRTGGHYPAPLRAIEVVRLGLEDGLQAGFDAEARATGELATSPVAKSLIHVFRLMEDAKKGRGLEVGDLDAKGETVKGGRGGVNVEPRDVHAVGVLGAGVMGGGIAQLVAHETDLPVRMKDIAADALGSGMEEASGLFDKLVKKRRLSEERKRRKMALIQPTLDYSGFGKLDLVIEAVVEKLEIKQKVFAETASHTGEETVLASNTSSLSIDAIGAETPNPERVVGMHFFNPVHKMPLIEVIAGETTAPWAVNTVFAFSRRLGKTPILVKDAPGFLVNRLLLFTLSESLWLLEEGYSIEELDRALDEWGMPMGPLALTDEVGIDVAVKVAHILHDAFGDRLPIPDWLDKLPEDDRLGKKNGRGFYRYDDGERDEPDPEVYELLGLHPVERDSDPAYLVDRMVLRMVDEAARCLEERVVTSPADLDLALILGTGFPPFRGGLCKWADGRGLASLCEQLGRLAESVGPRYAPSKALTDAAASGGFYAHDWGG